jgi:hypothetical protein
MTRKLIDRLFEDTDVERRKWADRNKQYRRTGRSQWKTDHNSDLPTGGKEVKRRAETTPDSIFFSGEPYITFILDHSGHGVGTTHGTHNDLRRAARAALVDEYDDEDENESVSNLTFINDETFEPDSDRDADVYGRACRMWHDGKPIVAFWSNLNDAMDGVDAAIDLCCTMNSRFPTDHRQYNISAADWEGTYNDLFPTPVDDRQMKFDLDGAAEPEAKPPELEQDVERRARVELLKQKHIMSPDVKAAMGFKPDYIKPGPGLRTRQAAFASESKA